MGKHSIEHRFAKAMQHAGNMYLKRGFKARIAEITQMPASYVSEIFNEVKGCPEDKRRLIMSAIFDLVPSFPARSYEAMLDLGGWIIDGKSPEDWQSSLRYYKSTASSALVRSSTTRTSLSHNVEASSEPSFGPSTREILRLPVISWVQAGNWHEAEESFQPGDADDWVDTTATTNPESFALVVRGDSMQPLFLEGETIIVDPGREAENGSYVIVKNGDNATFKQLILDGDKVFLRPLNNRYPVRDMTGIEFKIVGVVVAKEMRFVS